MTITLAHYFTLTTRLFMGSANALAWGRTLVGPTGGRA